MNEDFSKAKVVGPGETQNEITVLETGLAMNQGALESITRGEIDIQIATAHRFPRSINAFLKETRSMALGDEETAESCFYSLPRAEKMLPPGPSIRLMEFAASAWGNLRYGGRIIGEEPEHIVAQGVAHDLERNIAVTVEVRRRIINKYGKRYNADMINVTAMAGISIACRNALLRVIPRAYIKPIVDEAVKVAVGNQQTLSQKRDNALEFFARLGISNERVFTRLEIVGKEDITLGHIEILLGLKTALKENAANLDDEFPENNSPKLTGD